jgi:hypothetical protein
MYRLPTIARRLALTMLLLASTAAVPQGAGTRYTVEILVFRNSGQTSPLPADTPLQTDTDDGVDATVAGVRRLSSAASRLKAGGIKVLAHTAWTQSPASCGGLACRNAVRGVPVVQVGMARTGVTGKAGVQRGSAGMYLGVDLTFDDAGRRYHILESRLVKVDQPQYFDHPAIGVLAVFTAANP